MPTETSTTARCVRPRSPTSRPCTGITRYDIACDFHTAPSEITFTQGRPRFRERVVQNPAEQPAVGHIPRKGYVGIFPLILELLPLDSRRFGAVLDFIESPVHLWTGEYEWSSDPY